MSDATWPSGSTVRLSASGSLSVATWKLFAAITVWRSRGHSPSV